MNNRLKKLNIIITIISLLIMFFVFSLNLHADDEIEVYVSFPEYVEANDDFDSYLVVKGTDGYELVLGEDYERTYTNDDAVGEVAEVQINITNPNYMITDSIFQFTIVDEIIDLDEYGIDLSFIAVELENDEASIDSIFLDLLDDYYETIEITNTTATSIGTKNFTVNAKNGKAVVLTYTHNGRKNEIFLEDGTKDFPWYVRNHILTQDEFTSGALVFSDIDDISYEVGLSTTVEWNGNVTYNDISLARGINYNYNVSVIDDNGNQYTNESDAGLDEYAADGTLYYVRLLFEFRGEYAGNITVKYKLKPSIENFEPQNDDLTYFSGGFEYYYTGEEIVPDFYLQKTIHGENVRLTKGVDFEIDTNNEYYVNASDETRLLRIVGIGDYSGTQDVMYKILPVESNNLTLDISRYVLSDDLTIDNPTPTVTIKYGNVTLVEGTDYELRYSENEDYGDATVSIAYKGNYTGTTDPYNYYIAKVVIKLYDDYHIDVNNLYAKTDENGDASIRPVFADLLADYGSYITVGDLEAKGIGVHETQFVFDEKVYPECHSSNAGEEAYYMYMDSNIYWYSCNELITDINDDELEITGLDSTGYYIGMGTTSSWNGTITYKGVELTRAEEPSSQTGDYYIDLIEVLDSEGNRHSNGYEDGVDARSADGRVFTEYVHINFINNYGGQIVATYKICPSIEACLPIMNDDAPYGDGYARYEYTGDYILPDFDLKLEIGDSYRVLKYGTDFKLVESDDNVIGRDYQDSGYMLMYEGIGDYAGWFYMHYMINPVDISSDRFYIEVPNTFYRDPDNLNLEFDVYIYDTLLYYQLIQYTDYEIAEDGGIYLRGINNYSGEIYYEVSMASKKISNEDISIEYDLVEEENIMFFINEVTKPRITILDGETKLVEGTDYKLSFDGDFTLYGSKIRYYIKGLNDYYIFYVGEFKLGANGIIEEAAQDIINSATESSSFDLNSINFEDLSGLSKAELIKAKEFYNNLEKYIVDNKINITVNEHLKSMGYDTELTNEEIASQLKLYLDTYASSVGYSNFDSQVDDVINALTVEEEKGIAKEELTAFIHRHNKATTIEKLHQVVSDKNDELDSIYYEQCLSDEDRSNYFEELTNKVHEIKDVTIIIVKHTQSQAIANNNIEAYYEELKNSGKYNDAQLALLKEVFDEMQQKVEGVLSGSNIDDQLEIQEQLNQIVTEAIEKLSNVKITNIETNVESETQALVSSSSGMESNTTLSVEKALTNVSIAISRAIKSNNVYGENDGILLIKNKDVKDAFDINLEVDGQKKTEFEGEYTVRILLDDKLKSFNNLQVIYIASDGSVEVLNTTVDGDYLVFVTTHFSTYYLLGDKLVDFAPVIKILLAVIVALIILIVYLVLRIKKKKISELGFVLSLFLVPLSSIVSINVLMVCIVLGVIAAILLVVAILLAIKDYKIDRGLQDEE